MAELESQPLSDEERAELEELRAEKARREAREEARREREELAALRAERAKSDEPKSSRDEMTFAQRMVTSKEPTGENEIPGMAPAQKIIIVLALIAFVIFMGYTILTSMGLL